MPILIFSLPFPALPFPFIFFFFKKRGKCHSLSPLHWRGRSFALVGKFCVETQCAGGERPLGTGSQS